MRSSMKILPFSLRRLPLRKPLAAAVLLCALAAAASAQTVPTLSALTTNPTVAVSGQPFFFTLTGTNFDPATVQVVISGPGCTPCLIANGQLASKTATTVSGGTLLATAGNYTMAVQNGTGTASNTQALQVSTPGPVLPSSLTFNYQSGGQVPPAQTLSLQSPGGTGLQTSYSVDFPTVNWLTASPTGGLTPATVSVSITPVNLAPGTYNTTLGIRFAGGTNVSVPITLNVQVVTGGGTGNPNQVLSHIADSQGWQTTIVLVNHDTEPAPYSVRFYGSQTTGRSASVPLEMAFTGLAGRTSLVDGTIPVGGIRVIQTVGNDNVLNMGWAELVTNKNIQGSSVFRDRNGRQEAAVALTNGVRAFLLPFDNTGGRVTSFALINTNPSQPVTVTATVRDENGTQLNQVNIPLQPRGHVATETTVQFPLSANQRGVVEFVTTNADISGLGIRFDAPPTTPGAARPFTSFPVQPRR